MATPAEIRAQYYRSKRRSPQAQAIAERLENAPRESITRSRQISGYNTGQDPSLQAMSAAELALSPGGFSSVGVDSVARREAVRAALETEAPSWLPAEVRSRYQQRQDRLGQKLTEREKEQAEFSRMAGVEAPAMGGEELVSSATRRQREQAGQYTKADEALEKAGVTAESYWAEDPMKTGSFVREARTPEGNVITQRIGPEGYSSVSMPESEADAMAQQRQERQAAEEDSFLKSEAAKTEIEKKRAKATEARGEREGQMAAELFASWDVRKQDLAEGKKLQKDLRRRLTAINRALREDNPFKQRSERGGGYGKAMSIAEFNDLLDQKAMIEEDLARRESGFSKGITGLGREARQSREERDRFRTEMRDKFLARQKAAELESGGVEEAKSQTTPAMEAINAYLRSMFGDMPELSATNR